jgi:hypothetical protein
VAVAAGLLLAAGTARAAEDLSQLDKGHRVLVERGLQIQAQCFYQPQDLGMTSYTFDPRPYLDANFTGINWHYRPVNTVFAAAYPAFPWARWMVQTGETDLSSAELAWKGQFVALQYKDENSLNSADVRADFKAWFEAARPKYPGTILYTNQLAFDATDANLAAYMSESRPDMLCMDSYRWKVGNTEGTWHLFSDMQRYRKAALRGHDGSGARPIPYALFPQTFHGENLWRDPSESELRVGHFGPWTFGYTFTFDFTYNYGTSSLFVSGTDTSRPTAAYQQLKEINRRGRNLGPALVRLLSRDVRFIAGQSRDAGGNIVDNANPIDMPGWQFGVNDPYLRGWTITNPGTKNGGLRGDVLIAWFKVLDESFDGPAYSNEVYFMVLNALRDPAGSAADCRQQIQLNFQFGTAAVRRVLRLNQDVGKAEPIELPIIPDSGGRRHLTLTYDGGTAELFKFDTGAPFVGVPMMPDTTAPAPASSFSVRPGVERATLSWTNPPDPDFAGTLIRRRQGSAPASTGDGELVADLAGAPAGAQEFLDPAVPGTRTWHYAAFAHDAVPNYAPAAVASGLVQHHADLDLDNDADQSDFALIQKCLNSEGVPYGEGCSTADQDGDGDVDALDIWAFTDCMQGATIPPGC